MAAKFSSILGGLFGYLYMLPQTGSQHFISVSLGMDKTLTCPFGFLRRSVRDLSKLLNPSLGFVAHV